MIRLFHVSDVHFGCEDAGAVAWFDALVQAERPDAVVMTGDLTMRARSAEFAAAGAWLQRMGVPTTVEVGNHDLPYFNPWKRLVTPYRRYQAIEHLIERPLDLADVTIVPLKTTARVQARLDWSKGHVSDGALARTLKLIAEAPRSKLILVAAHHPLVEAGPAATAGTTHGCKALAALAEAGVAAVLTGHVHEPYDVAYCIGERTVRLIGAGTLSRRVRHSPAAFNELRVVDGRIEVICRTMSAAVDVAVKRERAGA